MDQFYSKENREEPTVYTSADLELNLPGNNNDSDDSGDSDERRLFELPKRKIRRPPSMAFKRKIGTSNPCLTTARSCCRLCSTSLLPILFAVFIVSTVLCIGFLMLGIAGMKSEISMLKVKVNNAEESERESVGRTTELRKEFELKLMSMENHDTKLKNLKEYIKHLEKKMLSMNTSINDMQNSPSFHVTKQITQLNSDIDSIKSGMADTGSDIGKLEHTNKELLDEIKSLKKENNKLEEQLYNVTVQVSLLKNEPPPSLTTTPKTLVVTLTPDEDLPISRKEAKLLIKNEELKHNKSLHSAIITFDEDVNELRNIVTRINRTSSERITEIKLKYDEFQKKINNISMKSPMTPVNVSMETFVNNHTEVLMSTPRTTPMVASKPSTTHLVTPKPSQAETPVPTERNIPKDEMTQKTTTTQITTSVVKPSSNNSKIPSLHEIPLNKTNANNISFVENPIIEDSVKRQPVNKLLSQSQDVMHKIPAPLKPEIEKSGPEINRKLRGSEENEKSPLLSRKHELNKADSDDSETYHSRNIAKRLEKLKKMDPDYLKHLLETLKRDQQSDEYERRSNEDLLPRDDDDDDSEFVPRDDSGGDYSYNPYTE